MMKIIFASLLVISSYANMLNYKDDNKIRTVSVEDLGKIYILEKTQSYVQYFQKDEIIVNVKNITPEYMKDIENKFQLSNTNILSSGEFIYKLNGDDVLTVCEQLSKDENIVSVKPLINKTIVMQ